MGITDSLLALQQEADQQQQQEPQDNWVKDLIDKRFQPDSKRIIRKPVGFDFKRDPFDPSSYYKQLGTFRDISHLATQVTNQEVANREEAERQRDEALRQQQIEAALKGINPNYTGGGEDDSTNYSSGSHKYKLGKVSSNTSAAADYWGNKYGIKTVYGYGSGSVPGSDHPKGRAIDLMINNVANGKARGTAMANDIIKNYKSWNVKYVIWNRYIWHPGRGWSRYSGPSPHTDHVHVSFNK